ncbi:MAG: hypothetical protein PHV36_14660 [Elusimicrobiales bacterium]|nr:hypothetical protein [Elusimicrobiales bacterium]
MTKKYLRILNIDNDRSCQRVTAEFLTLVGGHMVEVAYTGREGITKASALAPDIILLRPNLPDMHAPEVMNKLASAEKTGCIPVIILADTSPANASRTDITNRLNLSILERKPLKLFNLLNEIKAIGGSKT